ncbi:CvpA family protein [Candidatus Uhrbacteria bacterium]|nr:CvpA family protein [Candidatus Uhrbacteria bacterium]
MTFIDILILVIIGAFVFFGFFFGFVHTFGSLIGTIIGIFVATRLVDPTFDMFGFLLGNGDLAKVIVFIILFLFTSRIIGLLLWFVNGLFYVFAFIPFAGMINRLIGALFGLVEGVVVVGVVIFYAMQILPDDTLLFALEGSAMAKYLVAAMMALQVFFPEGMKVK